MPLDHHHWCASECRRVDLACVRRSMTQRLPDNAAAACTFFICDAASRPHVESVGAVGVAVRADPACFCQRHGQRVVRGGCCASSCHPNSLCPPPRCTHCTRPPPTPWAERTWGLYRTAGQPAATCGDTERSAERLGGGVVVQRSCAGRLDEKPASDTEVALQKIRDAMLHERYEVACSGPSDAGSHVGKRLSWSRATMGERVEVAVEVAARTGRMDMHIVWEAERDDYWRGVAGRKRVGGSRAVRYCSALVCMWVGGCGLRWPQQLRGAATDHVLCDDSAGVDYFVRGDVVPRGQGGVRFGDGLLLTPDRYCAHDLQRVHWHPWLRAPSAARRPSSAGSPAQLCRCLRPRVIVHVTLSTGLATPRCGSVAEKTQRARKRQSQSSSTALLTQNPADARPGRVRLLTDVGATTRAAASPPPLPPPPSLSRTEGPTT